MDISGTETLQDVRDLISGVSLGGRTLQASLSANGLDIDYADAGGGVLRVTDIGIGTSAKDLGIETSVPFRVYQSREGTFDPIVRRTTTIAQLQANTGLDLQGGIEIIQGTKRFRVELSNAQTVEDMLNAIERTGALESRHRSRKMGGHYRFDRSKAEPTFRFKSRKEIWLRV